MSRWRVDPWAAVAAVLAVVMVGVYLRVVGEQEGTAAAWFVVALSLGAVGAAYGAVRSAPHRRAVLVGVGLVLGAAGLLGILSIGLPVVLAGGLCLVGASRPRATDREAGAR